MKKKVFLGIDTSNYMTSICFINEDRKVMYEAKKLLEVKKGERGLQQSQAVFQHIKNLPSLLKSFHDAATIEILGIGVSKAPRPVEGSYMPVFMTGVSIAESISAIHQIPICYTTHQEGHIAAGFYSIEERPTRSECLAIHISGGTSEILLVRINKSSYEIKKIGGTLDLHAGQLIDRVGVMLDFPFPAGKYIEELAQHSSNDFLRIPSTVRDFSFHFSGAENEAMKRIAKGEPIQQIARAIEHVIAASIEKSLRNAVESGLPKEVLIVGGVAQNQYIRDYLLKKLEHQAVGAKLYFADKTYSGDNAFGVANIALNHFVYQDYT